MLPKIRAKWTSHVHTLSLCGFCSQQLHDATQAVSERGGRFPVAKWKVRKHADPKKNEGIPRTFRAPLDLRISVLAWSLQWVNNPIGSLGGAPPTKPQRSWKRCPTFFSNPFWKSKLFWFQPTNKINFNRFCYGQKESPKCQGLPCKIRDPYHHSATMP